MLDNTVPDHGVLGGRDPLAVMLEARSVALVGASPRPGSLGSRMISEVAKSPSRPRTYLVNPRHATIGPGKAYPSLAAMSRSSCWPRARRTAAGRWWPR